MSSPRLPAPIRDLLDERRPDAEVRRAWQRLQARRSQRGPRTFRRQVAMIALASALVSALLVYVFGVRVASTPLLRLADGHDVPQVFRETRGAAFDDGSRVELGESTHLDVLESAPHNFTLALRRGVAAFDIRPGGPRVWKVECGPVTVEVVGTHFTLTRDDEKLRVTVERGAVLVSGAPVPDHVVRLGPGGALDVMLARPVTSGTTSPAPQGSAMATAQAERVVPRSPSGQATAETKPPVAPATPLAPSAPAAIEAAPAPSAAPEPTVDALLAQADDARVSGRFQEAAAILERVVNERSGTSATLAEFSLGRLYLDSMGDGARAAPHFSRALAGGLPSTLAEDAYARLVEAYARAGDADAAANVAASYRRRYPSGRRTNDVNRWSPAR